MPTPHVQLVRIDVAWAVAIHRAAYGIDPRRVEIGLMAMRSLDDAGAGRWHGDVPLVVGSLDDLTRAIR